MRDDNTKKELNAMNQHLEKRRKELLKKKESGQKLSVPEMNELARSNFAPFPPRNN